MATPWTLPTIFTQYSEPCAESFDIAWNSDSGFDTLRFNDGSFLTTRQPLRHIARSPKYDITQKTYFLQLTGYQFYNLPDVITGITARLSMNRRGRITDQTIQLVKNSELIGDNKASLTLEPIKIYGGDTDLWATQSLTASDLQDPDFGIVLRFQSHPHWPHRDAAAIDTVELQIS